MQTFKLSQFRNSIKDGYLPSDWRSRVTDSSELVLTESGYIALMEDCIVTQSDCIYHSDNDESEFEYSERENGYLDSHLCVYAYVKRNRYESSQDWILETESIEIGCEYYLDDNEVISSYGFILTEDDGWVEEDNAYYHESDGCYYTYEEEEEEEEEEETTFEYHSGKRRNFTNSETTFKIGFEVEKEDEEVRNSELASELFNRTGWAKERDGSLNSETGFELVSPIFPLFESNFELELNKVKKYLNAQFSDSCGGHINYSIKDKSAKETFELVSGYLPLIYSIYNHRIGNTYCKAKKKENIYLDNEKYQAVCLKSGYIEFRIFPVVKNIQNLLWRIELMKIMSLNPQSDGLKVIENMVDSDSDLHNHLLKVFTKEKLINKVKLAIRHLTEIEEVNIPSLKMEEIGKKSTLILNS